MMSLARISGEAESIFDQLCRGLDAHDFPNAFQERFVNVLCDVWQAHLLYSNR
jgi:hypothetical protein